MDTAEIDRQVAQFAASYPFALDPFQVTAIRTFLTGDSVMVAAPTGIGKALAANTPVLTPTGWQSIADLRPGDAVIGANGLPVTVLGVYPQGIRPAYHVTFTDGISVVCDLEHLWAVNTKSRRHDRLPWKVLTLGQILDEGLTENGGHRHFVPLVKPVAFAYAEPREEIELARGRMHTGLTQRALAARVGVSQGTIVRWENGRKSVAVEYRDVLAEALHEAGPRPRLDPYLLGLILGDGGLSTGTVRFSSADAELIQSFSSLLPPTVELIKDGGRPYDWLVVSKHRRSRNAVVIALRELGLLGHRAEGKFVPQSYKFASIADRLALLQGLLDSDASMDLRGYLEYTTVSLRLAEDVALLVRSLGGRTRICQKRTTGQLAYRMSIKLPGEIAPFRLQRKLERYRARPRKQPCRAIAKVELVGETEMVCIAVDAPDGLFVVDGFVVTHNTVVAEFGIYEGVRRRGRVFYTTPIKALSNQKFRDLRQTYAEGVGLLTGDISENPGAQIVVMTTEVLRNMLLQTPWELDAVDVIIFDEIHYLADPERGTTWEESIILCPEHIQFVCLSATVSNAGEIAAWIGRTHRPITLITHFERAVPLALYYFLDGEARPVIDHTGRQIANFNRIGGEIRRRGAGGSPAGPDALRVEPHPNDVVRQLRAAKLLPAIYFLFSRRDCERYAELCANLRLDFVADAGPSARAAIEQIIEAHLGQMGSADRQLEQVQLTARLARRGIGFHHAGLLPILKQLVEQLFSRGLMNVVFATDTLALGVNMPARSVVVGRMSKWDGQRTRALIPNEFQQMAGRAGRRGMDEEGHVIVPYSPYITFEETLGIATGPLHPVRSAFKVRYNTVLNLWDPPRGERVRQFLGQSLAQFQTARRIRELEDEALAAQARADAVPRGCLIGYDNGDDLLHEYGGLGQAIDAAQAKERSVLAEMDELRQSLVSTPWKEPGRQALRIAFRTLAPGSMVHLRDRGWAAFVGRGNGNGIGLFLPLDPFRQQEGVTEGGPVPVVLVQEYRQVDYLTPQGAWIELPQALMNLQLPRPDAAAIVGPAEIERMRAEAAALDLPDLDAWAARHREERARFLAEETAALEEALADARAKVAELSVRRNGHVCHTCAVRKEHRNNLREAERLDRERADLDNRLAAEMRQEEERVRTLIRGIANVLHRFGYLHRGEPTAKADTLAGVFDNNGLIITEMLDHGVFDDLRPGDVAEVFSWFAFDRDFRGTNRYQLSVHLVERRDRINEIEHAVIATERHNDLFISTGFNEGFFGPVRAWCEGAAMSRLTESIDLSEGDLVLTINKTIDLMRQVRTMLGTTMPQHPLRSTLAAAERLALRDIVAQSYTFGFLPQSPDTSDAEAVNLAAGEESVEIVGGEDE